MIAALTNHLWQSTLFVLAAGLVAMALRKNGAHVRHRVWVVASLKFLVPFSILMSLGGALTGLLPAATIAAPVTETAPDLSAAVDRIAQPFASDVFFASTPVPATAATTNWTAIVAIGIWACGFVTVALMRFGGWRRIRAAVRTSVPIELPGGVPVRSSAGLLEPGVVGIWHPVLLLPAGIERHLTPSQLDAVMAHELCHMRRHDNLTSAIHMMVEAAFWFHPLVWFVGARLVDERERACDEYVLRVCGAPQTYAESLLNVCKLYVESPLACVSGVSGSDLKKRVSAIMGNRIGLQLNLARKVALGLAATLAIVLPLAAGIVTAPVRASEFVVDQGRSSAGTSPATFEIVSIKPCEGNSPTIDRGAPPPPGGRGGVSPWAAQASPGSVYWNCATLAQLVAQAYADQDHPLLNVNTQLDFRNAFQPKHVRGGPTWVTTDKFTIEARSSAELTSPALAGRPTRAMVELPAAMSQALRATLEDRFQLKVHRATEQRDMYALKIGKNGLNKERMKETKPGDCVTSDAYFAADPAARNALKICGRYFSGMTSLEFTDFTLRHLAEALSSMMDLYVIDQTGVESKFTFVLEYANAATTHDDRLIGGLELLGLRIDQTKGPAEYLVIDGAQKPRPDQPTEPPASASAAAPAFTKVLATAGMQAGAATAGQAVLKFDVVSVKPCAPDAPSQTRGAGGSPITSPGRLYLQCYPLSTMLGEAYIFFADGRAHALTANLDVGVEGGPDWMKTERYTVEAKTEQVAPAAVMRGPMLQAVLEDRFKLKIRRVTREMPIYELVVAKSGAKVAPYTGHDCVIKDDAVWPPLTLPEGQRYCGDRTTRDGDRVLREGVLTLDVLANLQGFDRPLVNRTGITAPVSYRFEYSFNIMTGAQGDRQAAIAAALKNQLGLEVRASTGPRDFLVIDRAERPAPDSPAPTRATGGGK